MKLKQIISLVVSAVTLLTCMPVEVLEVQTTTETELSETGSIENDLSIEGSCSLGNLIAEELNGEYSEQLEANSSGVYSIEATGTNAVVTFETDRDCTLVAAVYDEN